MADDRDSNPPIPPKVDFDELPETERLMRFDERVVPFVRASEQKALPPPGVKLLSWQEMLARQAAQDFLIDGILERGWLYAMTGTTGSGKTALATLFSVVMATDEMPKTIGPHEVQPGRVIYFAGENPPDTTRRFSGMQLKYDLTATARLSFVEGAFSLEQHYLAVKEQMAKIGEADLIVVDTAQAFAYHNGVKEENANMEMVKYATMLRSLTKLPGNPAVLVLCHPTKNAPQDPEAMIPRGGGGFLNEIDANIVLLTQDANTVTMQPHPGKFRGMPFQPMTFALSPYTHPSFTTKQGKPGYTVVAELLADQAVDERMTTRAEADRSILAALYFAKTGMRQKLIADTIQRNKQTVSQALNRLIKNQLVRKGKLDSGVYELTEAGKAEAKKL